MGFVEQKIHSALKLEGVFEICIFRTVQFGNKGGTAKKPLALQEQFNTLSQAFVTSIVAQKGQLKQQFLHQQVVSPCLNWQGFRFWCGLLATKCQKIQEI